MDTKSFVKPIFGFDLTEGKNSTKTNCDIFTAKKLSENTSQNLEEKSESLEESVEKSNLPIPLTIIKYLGLWLGLLVVGSMFGVDGGPAQAFRNAPVLMVSGIIGLVLGLTLMAVSKVKEKKVLKEENAYEKLDELTAMANSAYAELGVPSTAYDVDILVFNYTVKDGKMKMHTPVMAASPFVNPHLKLYLEDFSLCLTDIGAVYKFPTESLRSIKRIKKTAILSSWNKDEPFNKGYYKQFKLGSSNYGVHCKPYYLLEIEKDGEIYGVYFPSYELPVFEQLTRLTAIDPKGDEE